MEKQRNYREVFAAAIQADARIYRPWMFSDEIMITRNNQNYYIPMRSKLMRPEESYARTERYPIQVMVLGQSAKILSHRLYKCMGISALINTKR
jgi:hypothetical protein